MAVENLSKTSPTDSAAQPELIRPTLMAMVGVAMSALWTCLLIVHWSAAAQAAPQAVAYQSVWLAVFAVTALASMLLILQKRWAHQLLLTLFALLTIGSLAHLMGVLLWTDDSWWGTSLPPLLLTMPVFVLALAGTAAMTATSGPRTRLRYSSVVTVSVAAAIALAVLVNMIGQKDYIRRSTEMLGRYGLTDRTKRVLESIDQPIRLTAAYTSTNPKRLGREYGPRVIDLLKEMAEFGRRNNRSIEVINASDDVARDEVITDLKKRFRLRAQDHDQFINNVHRASGGMVQSLAESAQAWQMADQAVYVRQWSLAPGLARELKRVSRELENLDAKVQGQLQSAALPDYAGLTNELIQGLQQSRDDVQKFVLLCRQIQTIPGEIDANRAKTLQAVDRCTTYAEEMLQAIGTPDDVVPDQPAPLLRRYVRKARDTAAAAKFAAQLLQNVAGETNIPLLHTSQEWLLQLDTGDGAVRGISPAELFMRYGMLLEQQAEELDMTVAAAKDEFLRELLVQVRSQAVAIGGSLVGSAKVVHESLPLLAEMDPASRAMLAQADEGGPLFNTMAELTVWLDTAQALPALEATELSQAISEDNILLIEVGDQTEVIPFEDIWPLRAGIGGQDDTEQSRFFNGNATIGSKLLGMAHEPFATVVLTYYEPEIPPQLAPYLPSPPLSPENLRELTRRLESVNFEVRQWNLSEPPPPPTDGADDADRPRVLLVLAPPEPLPLGEMAPGRFGDAEIAKIKSLVDTGTPALFLTGFMPPQGFAGQAIQPNYGYGPYLRSDWGIDVLSDFRIVSASPDKTTPGKFHVNLKRLFHLPLSLFSDHMIGAPLRGQRVLWTDLCPLEIDAALPGGVVVEPLLSVPEAWGSDTWASRDVRELYRQVYAKDRSLIQPSFDGGDKRIPDGGMPVAVAATRERTGRPDIADAQTSRIVVLTMALSLVDGYLTQYEHQFESGDLTVSDPPRANAYVVLNSLYWLIGSYHYIAAPALASEPIADVSGGTYATLWVLCVVVAPLAVVSLGGVVMVLRRR